MRDLTASQVNRAGQRIRRHVRGEGEDAEQLRASLDTLVAFRALHARPLQTATMGLRSVVNSEGLPVQVSQRLKRVPTIVDKLVREPTLALSRMQDIGGCRAVLPSIAGIRAVQRCLEARPTKVREFIAVSDYITSPRRSGYRGVHVIMKYHGRTIEMQLRTPFMHEWAVTVERLTDRYGEDYKSTWNSTVSPLLALVSEAMALEESGAPVPSSLVQRIEEQRILSVDYLHGRA